MSRTKRLKVAFISWVLPDEFGGGGSIAMHRHFVLHDDFEMHYFSSNCSQTCESTPLEASGITQRLQRTRFSAALAQYEYRSNHKRWVKLVTRACKELNPDVIFTVADPYDSWVAYQVSRSLRVPLVTNFQDWWPYAVYPSHREPSISTRREMDRRFRLIARGSVSVLCTSMGMKELVADHPNSHILYPSGAPLSSQPNPSHPPEPSKPLVVTYAGQFGGNVYGKALLELKNQIDAESADIDLRVFGNSAGSAQSVADALGSCYRGFRKFDELSHDLGESDILLAVMGFAGSGDRIWMRSSFTTKILDYVQFGKPVVVWGPDDCSPVRLAKETGFAVPCDDPSVKKLLETLNELRDQSNYMTAANNATKAATTFLNHDEIHKILVDQIQCAACRRPT